MIHKKIALPVLLIAASVFALASKPAAKNGMVYTSDFESVRAVILDDTPESFTISVDIPQNIVVDRNAEFFAVYTSVDKPDYCADYRAADMDYKRPRQFEREFDLSKRDDILNAINQHNCVLIPNISGKTEKTDMNEQG